METPAYKIVNHIEIGSKEEAMKLIERLLGDNAFFLVDPFPNNTWKIYVRAEYYDRAKVLREKAIEEVFLNNLFEETRDF